MTNHPNSADDTAPCIDGTGVATECLWEADASLNVVRVGRSFSDILERPVDTVVGTTWPDFLNGAGFDGTSGGKAVRDAMKAGREFKSIRCRVAGQTGRTIHLSLSGVPVDDGGRFAGYRGAVRDITPYAVVEEGLQRSESELRKILDNMQDVFLRADRRGRIVLMSPSASDLLGYPPAQLLHRKVLGFVAGTSERRRLLRLFRDGGTRLKGVSFRVRRADGETVWVSANAQTYFDGNGNPAGIEGTLRDIDEVKRAENRLRNSERRYRRLIELSPNGILVHRDGRILYANQGAAAILGTTVPDNLKGHALTDFAAPGDTDKVDAWVEKLADGWAVLEPAKIAFRGLDGTERVVEVHTSVTEFKDGLAAQSLLIDVTERQQIEKQLRLAATVFDTASEAILISSPDNRVLAVNEAFCEITGYAEADIVGRNPNILSSGRHDASFYAKLWETLQTTGQWQGEIWNRRKNGEVFPEWLSIAVVRNETGAVQHYVAIFMDITQRKKDEERIRYQANFDALTGLPNRNLFTDRLWQTIAVSRRESTLTALMFIDLDRFKVVNDTLGHAAGDALLEEAAHRLRSVVREEDTVARLGGDEFMIILPNIERETSASVVADKILNILARPFYLAGTEAHIGGSIGITLYPRDGATAEELLRNADAAMYKAKERGRNLYHFYTPELQEQALTRLDLENALRAALEEEQFEVHYQPQIDVSTNTVCGAEALVRWRRPDHGLVAPGHFIPLSEETGLVVPIGEWVMREVCRQIVEWDGIGVSVPRVAINLSLRQFKDQDIPALVKRIAVETGVDTRRLEFEITESLFAEDVEQTLAVLRRLKDLGVALAVDDFGTGYSSLGYLRRFPIDVLKIDRSFIDGVNDDPDDAAIAEAIIAMAHRLNLEVVAEGVETHDQLAQLHGMRCDIAQGYLISRPLPKDESRAWFAERLVEPIDMT